MLSQNDIRETLYILQVCLIWLKNGLFYLIERFRCSGIVVKFVVTKKKQTIYVICVWMT